METAASACAARLAEIRRPGFRYVLNYSAWYGSPEAVLSYANRAAELGLQLIWPLNHPAWRGLASLSDTYPSLAGGRTHVPNAELAAEAIRLVANHPATWGFYIGDELPHWEAQRVRALSAFVRDLAPDKPQLYVARPGAENLEPFAPIADVAGIDTYPVGSGDPTVGRAARSAETVTRAAGVQTAMVLQAFSWSRYRGDAHPPRYANAFGMRAMRDAAIRHADPSLILWYSYQDIVRSDNPERRWGALSRAAFAPTDGRRSSVPESAGMPRAGVR